MEEGRNGRREGESERRREREGRRQVGRHGGREGEKKVREEEKGREVLLEWKVRSDKKVKED